MVAADRQHWHGQFALRDKGFVVDGVLRKGRELIKRRMHGAGPRIKPGVVLARRLVDATSGLADNSFQNRSR